MSRRTQDILFGETGQSLYIDCPDGRPSSVTSVTVWDYSASDTSTAESATTGSATVETNPNTTIDAASGSSETTRTKVYVAATTGAAVGRRYLVTSATYGHSEWIEVAGIAANDYLIAKHPLVNDYASSDTVQSTRVSISVDSTWVADVNNISPPYSPNPRYRVRWELVVGGVTKVYETAFDLVRYNAQHHVTALDVAQRMPGWIDYLPTDDRDDQGRSIIDRAFQALKFDLYAHNKADQAVRNPEAVDQLVICKAIELAVEDRVLMGAGGDLETARRIYQQRFDQFFVSPVVQMDTGDGAATQPDPSPLWRR